MNNILTDFIAELNMADLPKGQQKFHLIREVSKIPWGEARSIEDVLRLRKGTCTGKHKVLQAAFDILQIPYKTVVCTFKWGKQGINLPKHLQDILEKGEWEHGHNFVQIQDDNNNWIDVDITWDPQLKEYGFLSLPESWDGNMSFVGLKKVERRWDNASIDKMKKELIESLSPELKHRREKFLEQFILWVDSLR